MKSLQQYIIPFTGLKLGKHQFEFVIDESFFNEFDYSLVKKGELNVDLVLDKQESMLILDFKIAGKIAVSCDVCLAAYPENIDLDERQFVKFSDDLNLEDDTDEIIVLNRREHEINVATLIYEYINLGVPYINRCDDEGNTEWCDKEMIATLAKLSVNNDNKTEELPNNEIADPRWEALKKIKNK